MYSIHNKGKSVVAEGFIRALKSKIYKYLTSVSKNMYLDKLANMVNKYNSTYPSTIKMMPIDVRSSTYTDINKKKTIKKIPNLKLLIM